MNKIIKFSIFLLIALVLVACNTSNNDELRTFTLDELAQYSGVNGGTTYVAVDGIVYDVSDVFESGYHQGLLLGGTDATSVFASSPHSQAFLDELTQVGTLTTNQENTGNTLPVFTLDDLSQYTGANGTTAYIAVNGVIYDVTTAFTDGMHQGNQLGGTDATAVFESSPHSLSQLDLLPIVGSLEGYPTITDTTSTQNQSSTEDEFEDEEEDETETED